MTFDLFGAALLRALPCVRVPEQPVLAGRALLLCFVPVGGHETLAHAARDTVSIPIHFFALRDTCLTFRVPERPRAPVYIGARLTNIVIISMGFERTTRHTLSEQWFPEWRVGERVCSPAV